MSGFFLLFFPAAKHQRIPTGKISPEKVSGLILPQERRRRESGVVMKHESTSRSKAEAGLSTLPSTDWSVSHMNRPSEQATPFRTIPT